MFRSLCWGCGYMIEWDWVRDEVDSNDIYWQVRECRNCKMRRRYIIRKSDAYMPVRV